MSILVTALVWKHSRTEGSTLLVALAISDFADDDGVAFPAVSTLAAKARVSERTVQYALKQLTALGELSVEQGAGPRGCNLYRVGVQILRGANSAGVQPATQGGATRCTRTVIEPSVNKTTKPRAAPASDAGATFDFQAGVFVGLNGDRYGRWQEAYPALDVVAEVKRAAAWLHANPQNRKSNYERFLTNWLARAQDRAPRVNAPTGAHRNDRPNRFEQRDAWIAELTGRAPARSIRRIDPDDTIEMPH